MGKPLARRGVLGCAPVVVGLAMSEREQEEGNSLIIQLGELHVQLIGARGLKGVARSSRRGSLGGLLAGPTSNPYCELRVQDERRRGKTAHRTLDPSWRREMFTFGIGVPAALLFAPDESSGAPPGPCTSSRNKSKVLDEDGFKKKSCAQGEGSARADLSQRLSLHVTVRHDAEAEEPSGGGSSPSPSRSPSGTAADKKPSASDVTDAILGIATVSFSSLLTGVGSEAGHWDGWVQLQSEGGYDDGAGEVRLSLDFDPPPALHQGTQARLARIAKPKETWPLDMSAEYTVMGSSHAGVILTWQSPEGWPLSATVNRSLVCPVVSGHAKTDLLAEAAVLAERVLCSPAADAVESSVARVMEGGVPALAQEMQAAFSGGLDLARRWASGGPGGIPNIFDEVLWALGMPKSDVLCSPESDGNVMVENSAPGANSSEESALKGENLAPVTDLCCPITGCPIVSAVVAADGHTYERGAIERWLEHHDTSPMTGKVLETKALFPNYSLPAVGEGECKL